MATTYSIGTDGIVEWTFLDADYCRPAAQKDIISVLSENN
jgi:hypothetical protein